jgi:hypothetical protein
VLAHADLPEGWEEIPDERVEFAEKEDLDMTYDASEEGANE